MEVSHSIQGVVREKCPYLHAAARIRLEQSTVTRRVMTHTKELCCLSPTGTCRIDSSYTYKEIQIDYMHYLKGSWSKVGGSNKS